jgi:hypothetical protein
MSRHHPTHIPIGTRFGRLTVVGEADASARYWTIPVRCDCGTEKMVKKVNLTSKKPSSSCGHCLSGHRIGRPQSPETVAKIVATVLRKRGRLALYRNPPP